jgi:2-methylisocitrate lyase-like PEP mutase family enzyme
MGYLVSFWNLNGTDSANNQNMGWNAGYNFGSKDAAIVRWQAAAKAGADFIGTDQYEDVGRTIKAAGKSD